MKRLVLCAVAAAASAFAQYKLESAGPPPQEVNPSIRSQLQQDGAKVVGPNGTWCEVWFRTQEPDAANGQQNVSFTNIAQGALLGVIRFPSKAADRRGQALQPGVYTMRLSFYPQDGNHQGVAPTRDFALLVPAAQDTDVNATPNFNQLVAMSRKASGTAHPAVLNVWKPDSSSPRSLKQQDSDWVLYDSLGSRPIALIVVGTYSG